MRYFIDIAYDGTAYHGWQRQPQSITVQEELEKALTTLLRSEIAVTGAGRTDAGVHAKQLWVHFDYANLLTPDEQQHLVFRLNRFLPQAIAVKTMTPAAAEAHARFDAIERSYSYFIHQQKNPFLVNQSYFFEAEVDLELMNKAAKLLLGRQDFKCFSRSNTDVKTYLCDIREAFWSREEDRLVFRITADRFLRNMVRAVVGTLLDVGLKKTSVNELKDIIAGGERSEAGASAPAHGLYLTAVRYPEEIFIPYGRQ
ncbi:tRNA pseudouridine(38-40) synthase TruA [Leeuwenhoekiella parthenopeia]|uniref:tRNA pseudouridine synthase A n=1 Tax=Leeuwenhoekiella parthenopeia TaxID=2890320 RepID=A0ABS8GR13_9FLAO|nr:tRNA pseudouridine(38-40) synthase TruA [Leeuwenhoekiella parthenopeia]